MPATGAICCNEYRRNVVVTVAGVARSYTLLVSRCSGAGMARSAVGQSSGGLPRLARK